MPMLTSGGRTPKPWTLVSAARNMVIFRSQKGEFIMKNTGGGTDV